MPTLPDPPTICRVLPPHQRAFQHPVAPGSHNQPGSHIGFTLRARVETTLELTGRRTHCHFAVKGSGMKGSWACNQSHPANPQIVLHFSRFSSLHAREDFNFVTFLYWQRKCSLCKQIQSVLSTPCTNSLHAQTADTISSKASETYSCETCTITLLSDSCRTILSFERVSVIYFSGW